MQFGKKWSKQSILAWQITQKVGSGDVLIRKQIEDRQVNDKHLPSVILLVEFHGKGRVASDQSEKLV